MSAPLPTWLFVSYGGGHVQALLPVARRVRELGMARPVYLALTTAAPVVRAAGIETVAFTDVMEAGDVRARTHGERLVAGLQVQAADREESVAYLGLSYADMEDRLGEAEAAAQFARFGRQSFLPLGPVRRVFDRCKPSLVVATNSPRAERAAIETARACGIPSVCLLDLLGIWERDLLARPDYADALCVLNEGVRGSIVAAGRPAADVRVTGNPAFDSVLDPAVIARGQAARTAAGWRDLHVLLFASSPEPREIPNVAGVGDPDHPRRIEAALVEAVKANPKLALWIRRHPSEAPPAEIAALGHPRIRVSTREMPLHEVLHACDEVAVTVSTVGVEADLAGRFVTQVRGSILDSLSPYVSLGIADREVAAGAVASLYAPGARLPEARASASRAAVPATDRVVDVLRSVAGAANG